jgi:hypothetical protein
MTEMERRSQKQATNELLAALEAVREAARAHGEMARKLRDTLADGGIPIQPPRWAYFLKRYAWQLIGGTSLLLLGGLVERYSCSIVTYLLKLFG